MSALNAIRVLHVDDDESQLKYTKRFLENDKPLQITSCNSPSSALEIMRSVEFDCIVSDYQMPEIDGITFAKKVHETRDIPFIIYTGHGSEEIAEAAFAAGIDDYVRKEIDPSHYQVLAKRIVSVIEKQRTEESYHTLFENASDAIFIHDFEGKFLDVNRVACLRLGYSKKKLLKLSLADITASRNDAEFRDRVNRLRKAGSIVFETSNLTRTGQVIPVEVSARVIRFRGMNTVLAFSRDISERKRLENQMRRKLEALHKHAVNLVNMNTLNDVARYSFDVMEEVLGFTDGAFGVVEGKNLRFIYARTVPLDVLHEMPLDGNGISVRAVRTGKTQLVNNTRLDADFVRDGETSDLYSELDVPVKKDGKVVALINLEIDKLNAFTEEDKEIVEILSEHVASAISRIERIEAVKASEEKYRRLLDSSLDSVILLSGTKILYVNRNTAKLLGYDSTSELIGKDITVTLAEEEKDRITRRTLSRQRGEPQPSRYELKLAKKGGGTIVAEAVVTTIDYEGHRSVLAFARDITERKRYEKQIMALHRHAASLAQARSYGEVCESTLDAVESVIGFHIAAFLVNSSGALASIGNRGSPSTGKPLTLDSMGITVKTARERKSILVNDVRKDPDFVRGTTNSLSELAVPVILDGETLAVINLESTKLNAFTQLDQSLLETLSMHVASAFERIREVERMKEQEAIRVKELLEGATKITSMVRHDLRGPLQTILNISYLIRRSPEQVEEYAEGIDESVKYAAKILDDLKTVFGPHNLNKMPTALNTIVEKSLAGAIIPKSIRVEKRFGEPFPIEVDPVYMRRVVDNLLKNAVEAMPNGGTLTISVEKVSEVAELMVKDTGTGISPENVRNIFNPFHSNKPGGTGLGLTICKQVVEAHGGRITFKSQVGRGTTFTVELPMKIQNHAEDLQILGTLGEQLPLEQ